MWLRRQVRLVRHGGGILSSSFGIRQRSPLSPAGDQTALRRCRIGGRCQTSLHVRQRNQRREPFTFAWSRTFAARHRGQLGIHRHTWGVGLLITSFKLLMPCRRLLRVCASCHVQTAARFNASGVSKGVDVLFEIARRIGKLAQQRREVCATHPRVWRRSNRTWLTITEKTEAWAMPPFR